MNRTILLGVFSLVIFTTFAHTINNTRFVKIESDGNETPKYDFLPLGNSENVTFFVRQQNSDVRFMLTLDPTPSIPNIEISLQGYDQYYNTISKDGLVVTSNNAHYLNGNRYNEVTLVRDGNRTGVVDYYGFMNFFIYTYEPKYAYIGLSAGLQGNATFLLHADQLYN